jgi:hypothetical protein
MAEHLVAHGAQLPGHLVPEIREGQAASLQEQGARVCVATGADAGVACARQALAIGGHHDAAGDQQVGLGLLSEVLETVEVAFQVPVVGVEKGDLFEALFAGPAGPQ